MKSGLHKMLTLLFFDVCNIKRSVKTEEKNCMISNRPYQHFHVKTTVFDIVVGHFKRYTHT